MSTFYGQVEGCAQTPATRRGTANSGIRVSAQSYEGSVIVSMREPGQVRIELADSSSFYGSCIFDGSIRQLASIFEGADALDKNIGHYFKEEETA